MNFDEYFASKSQPFWKEGIMSLPERWKKVIKQNGSQQINLKQQISCIHFAKKKRKKLMVHPICIYFNLIINFFLDISEYYKSALESESEEVLPKLPTDANKFMYIVGLGVALLVLVLSLLIHFYK